jgi:hypothetical protein
MVLSGHIFDHRITQMYSVTVGKSVAQYNLPLGNPDSVC